jgi:hypothetical protein
MAWLKTQRRSLIARTDFHSESFWWRLFRTEAANNSLHRVVWSDIGRAPQAALLPAGDRAIPMNTCYVVACESMLDAAALVTLINSPLTAAWLSMIAEPAQGGYYRYMGWTMAMLPIPRNWRTARVPLARLYAKAMKGKTPPASEVFAKSLAAYRLSEEAVHDLMVWAQQ